MSRATRTAAEPATTRAQVAVRWLETLDAGAADWEAQLSVLAATLADALIHNDGQTLREILDPVRDQLARLFDRHGHAREVRGYLLALLTTARAGLERLPEPFVEQLATDSHAAHMLRALTEQSPLSSQQVRERLGTNASQISRVGRQLLAGGLVVQRRTGRTASWEITPRGMEVAGSGPKTRRSRRAH